VLEPPLAAFFDAGLSDHWPDLIVAALIALVGYFGSNRFSSMDDRHKRAEDKFKEVDTDLRDHDRRLTCVETVVEERHNRRGD
jgi:hypothetical protein